MKAKPDQYNTQLNVPSRGLCTFCNRALILPSGPEASPYLLVGEIPVVQEVVTGRAMSFAPKNTSGYGRPTSPNGWDVLAQELQKAGLGIQLFRGTNLWQHAKAPLITKADAKKSTPKEGSCDMDFHVNLMVKEFTGRTHVLLMGSAVTEALLGEKARAYIGLQVKVPAFPGTHFWVAPNPGHAISQPVGELRLAVERFVQDIRKTMK